MSIKREVEKTAKNVRDAIDEAANRAAAEGERAKRDLAGDEMTTGDKAKSKIVETKHEVIAEVDKAKRKIRDNT